MATSKFIRTFRSIAGAPITTAAIWLVPQANTYPTGALALTPHATRDGQYYRDNVPDGEYKIYIDPAGGSSPTLYEERLWIGDQRITDVTEDSEIINAHFDAADSYKLKSSGIGKEIIFDATFLTRIGSTPIVFNLNCELLSSSVFSLDIPSLCYFQQGTVVGEIANGGTTIFSTSGNTHVILINKSTRILSLLDFTALETLYNYEDYILCGYAFGANGRLSIKADYTVNGDYPYARTQDVNLPQKKYITSDSTIYKQVIDIYGDLKYTPVNNSSGSSIKNETDGALEVTAAGAGYSGIYMNTDFSIESEVLYRVRFLCKRVSGDTGKEWRVGWPIPAESQYVSFIPTNSWQFVSGVFRTANISYGMFISASDAVTNEVVQFKEFTIEKVGSNTGWLTDLATSLATFDNVEVPAGTHIINTTVVVPTGKRIFGVIGKSILQAGASVTKVLDITNSDNVVLEGLTIKGVMSDYTFTWGGVASGVVDTVSDAISQVGIGTKIGVFIDSSEKVFINNCEIKNFDKAGIEINGSGDTYGGGFRVRDCLIEHCYIGLLLDNAAEYSEIGGLTSRICQIAAYVTSGNLLFTGCFFQTARVGLVMTNGTNNSHGSFTGCSFNHNSLYGIILDSLDNGEVFTGGQVWYSNIYLLDSRGINFNGFLFASLTIYADGNHSGGGANLITNSMFVSGTIEHNYNSHTSNLLLKNNWLVGGGTPTAYNN